MSCASKHPCYICEARHEDGKWFNDSDLRTSIFIVEIHSKSSVFDEVKMDLNPSLEFEDSKGNKKNSITYYREVRY